MPNHEIFVTGGSSSTERRTVEGESLTRNLWRGFGNHGLYAVPLEGLDCTYKYRVGRDGWLGGGTCVVCGGAGTSEK